jgi:hypothetical protein
VVPRRPPGSILDHQLRSFKPNITDPPDRAPTSTDRGTTEIGTIIRSIGVAPERTIAPQPGAVEVAVDLPATSRRPPGTTARTHSTTQGPLLHPLHEVAEELRWTFHERRGWLIGISFNLVVARIWVGYTHFQPHSRDSFRIAGTATAVAVWVLATSSTPTSWGPTPTGWPATSRAVTA